MTTCCNFNRGPRECGNSGNEINQTINQIKNKSGYLQNYLIRNGKKLLINFKNPNNIPPGFINATIISTANVILDVENREKNPAFRHRGKSDKVFERLVTNMSAVDKTKQCFNKVINFTNLGLIYCNSGNPDDLVLTNEEIYLNNTDDIEMVVDIYYLNEEDPRADGAAAIVQNI
jgi:hypothetical protein